MEGLTKSLAGSLLLLSLLALGAEAAKDIFTNDFHVKIHPDHGKNVSRTFGYLYF